jgi:Transposase and inactivated derivatives
MSERENERPVRSATTYRVLKSAGLINRWNKSKPNSRKRGFGQPTRPHEQWHTDIKYVNFRGTFLFLISVIDGYSRYIVHHELRTSMEEYDVQITIERALEKFPSEKPRLISDNGSQYVSRDFAEFLRMAGLQHTRTSIHYPQSNGKIERFHESLNYECLRKRSLVDLEDARRQIAEYIDYYNTKRLHSSLYYLTPEDFLNGRIDERLKVRDEKLYQARLNRIEAKNAA